MTDTTHFFDIRKEPLITKEWRFIKSDPADYADGILVTGANSFIGTHVVRELEQRWDGPVHLLVRASSHSKAVEKMSLSFAQWELGSFHAENFTIHLGDVTLEKMGLKPTEYTNIKKETGFVLHLAMNPMFNLPYAHFRRLWLPELEQMIRFCSDSRHPKALHYPSSINNHYFTEDQDFEKLDRNTMLSGYTGFKWVAGKALQNAFHQGLKGCLYDVPLVMGSVEKSICPSHYAVWYFLDMFLKTGLYIDFAFPIIPVDILTEVIITNMMNEKQGKASRLVRPVLDKPVTHKQFGNMVANILGLKHSTPGKLREAFYDKHKFDFMVPGNFNALLEKVNALPAVWPEGFDARSLPDAAMVFVSNLNRILARTEDVKETDTTTTEVGKDEAAV